MVGAQKWNVRPCRVTLSLLVMRFRLPMGLIAVGATSSDEMGGVPLSRWSRWCLDIYTGVQSFGAVDETLEACGWSELGREVVMKVVVCGLLRLVLSRGTVAIGVIFVFEESNDDWVAIDVVVPPTLEYNPRFAWQQVLFRHLCHSKLNDIPS